MYFSSPYSFSIFWDVKVVLRKHFPLPFLTNCLIFFLNLLIIDDNDDDIDERNNRKETQENVHKNQNNLAAHLVEVSHMSCLAVFPDSRKQIKPSNQIQTL